MLDFYISTKYLKIFTKNYLTLNATNSNPPAIISKKKKKI